MLMTVGKQYTPRFAPSKQSPAVARRASDRANLNTFGEGACALLDIESRHGAATRPRAGVKPAKVVPARALRV
jgi:hypothetical protein